MLQRNLSTIFCSIFALLILVCLGCGDGIVESSKGERAQDELIFQNSHHPTSPDFNAYSTQELNHYAKVAFLNPLSTGERANIHRASNMSRTSTFNEVSQPTTLNGVCSLATGYGSGQAVGTNTMLQSHHAGLYDRENDIVQVRRKSLSGGIWPQNLNNPALGQEDYARDILQRFYSLGLTGLANPVPGNDIYYEHYLSNWRYNIVLDGYEHGKHDYILEVAEPKCLSLLPGLNAPLMGPGMFIDWMEIDPDENSPAPSERAWANAFTDLHDSSISTSNKSTFPLNISLLPGLTDATVSRGAVSEFGCQTGASQTPDPNDDYFTIVDYADVVTTSLDSREGVSGSGVWRRDVPDLVGYLWGIAVEKGTVGVSDSWDRSAPADYASTTPDPAAGIYTGVDVLTQQFEDEIDERDEGRKRPWNDSPEPTRSSDPNYDNENLPEFKTPEMNDEDQPEHCVGSCDREYEYRRSCKDKYAQLYPEWAELYTGEQHQYVASGVGIVGGPIIKDDSKYIADFGPVCAPWSEYPYSMFWQYVVHHVNDISGSIFGFGGTTVRPNLSLQYLSGKSFDTDNTYHQRVENIPFQNCAPGYVLSGVEFSRDSGGIRGARRILCTRIYKGNNALDQEIIPLKPSFYNTLPNYLRFVNEIGDVDAQVGLEWLTCDDDETQHISGFVMFYSSLSSAQLEGIYPLCTKNPDIREEQLCEAGEEGGPVDNMFFSKPPFGVVEWTDKQSPSCAVTQNCP
jgi:hypothetical protein